MATLTIQDVSRRSGLSEPALRYYEEIGLIGPVARDERSGHRRCRDDDLDTLQPDLLLRHAGRIEAQIATVQVHLEYLHKKAELWDARDRRDAGAEAAASRRVRDMYPRLEEVLR
jgi:MerR family copper efflux transcriptional regulator